MEKNIHWEYAELKLSHHNGWGYLTQGGRIAYRIGTETKAFYQKLAELGAEGWEAYAVHVLEEDGQAARIYYLKRPLPK